jgi:hypothetical protein
MKRRLSAATLSLNSWFSEDDQSVWTALSLLH